MVKKIEFSRLAGISAPCTTKLFKGRLKPALVGNLIDVDHPVIVEYLESRETPDPPATGIDPLYEEAVRFISGGGKLNAHQIQSNLKVGRQRAEQLVRQLKAAGIQPGVETKHEPTALTVKTAKPEPVVTQAELIEPPEDIREFLDMPLREVVARFGTEARFVDWLKAAKEIEVIHERRIKNRLAEGESIPCDVVEIGVIDVFTKSHLRLLQDGAKNITKTAMSKMASNHTEKEIEKEVSEIMSSFLRPAQRKSVQTLQEAQKGLV